MIIPVIAIILALSGGTAFAAEGTMPGDMLYPVKIHVNERVRVAIAVSDAAEAEAQTDLAMTRLDEAATLESRGTLTVEVRDRIAERFEQHEQKAERRIEKLEAKGRTEAAAALDGALEEQLRIHAAILAALDVQVAADATNDTTTTAQLSEDVHLRAEAVAEKRRAQEQRVERASKTESKQAAEGRKGSAEHKIIEVSRFIARAEDRGRVEADVITAAQVRIDAAKALVVEGTAKADAEEFGQAFVKFGEAHRTAQQAKLIVTLEGADNFPNEVRARLGIEATVDTDADNVDDEGVPENQDDAADTEDDDAARSDRSDAPRGNAEGRVDVEVRGNADVRGSESGQEVRVDTAVRGAINAIIPALP